jgi:hypothetical protein
MALEGMAREMLLRSPLRGKFPMQLFTVCAGNQRMLTINADHERDAWDALSSLGVMDDGEMTIRAATDDEVASWCGSADRGATCTFTLPLSASPAHHTAQSPIKGLISPVRIKT